MRVGKKGDQEDFSVHEHVLKEESALFRAALEKRWKEGQSHFISLPEDEPEVFAGEVLPRYELMLILGTADEQSVLASGVREVHQSKDRHEQLRTPRSAVRFERQTSE